jgi:hypothetical protein
MESFMPRETEYGWQPSQNQAFFIIAAGMVMAGVLAWLL